MAHGQWVGVADLHTSPPTPRAVGMIPKAGSGSVLSKELNLTPFLDAFPKRKYPEANRAYHALVRP